MVTEYPTLTALMAGREAGSVKARRIGWTDDLWFRPGRLLHAGPWLGLNSNGDIAKWSDASGPWLLVSEDAPALNTLRLEVAARVLAAMHVSDVGQPDEFLRRHAYALAEADALIAAARK